MRLPSDPVRRRHHPAPELPGPIVTIQTPTPTFPEEPDPEETDTTDASGITAAQEAELYDVILSTILYMFTNGGKDVGPYGASGAGYRLDVDGDGTEDWIIGNGDLYWLICTGGREGVSCYAFPNGNASVSVYGTEQGQLVIKGGGGIASALWESICVFRGTALEEALSTTTHFLNEETYTVYNAGTEPVDYTVDGKAVDKSGYDSAAAALGELTRLELTPFRFIRSTTLGPSQIQSTAALLEPLPFYSETLTADVNGDGVDDYGLFLAAHDSPGPEGMAITYETGSSIRDGWSGCCIVLLSSDYCVGTKVLGAEEARGLFHSSAGSEAAESSSLSALADGEYDVNLYSGGFQETAEGVYGYVDVTQEITFSDQYVGTLAVGGVLDLSRYGYDSISIQTMEFLDYGTQDIISFGEGEMRLFRDKGASTWKLAWPHAQWVTYTSERVPLLFAADAAIVDELESQSTRLNDIREFFSGPYPIDPTTIHITIQNGRVTNAIRYFTPQI